MTSTFATNSVPASFPIPTTQSIGIIMTTDQPSSCYALNTIPSYYESLSTSLNYITTDPSNPYLGVDPGITFTNDLISGVVAFPYSAPIVTTQIPNIDTLCSLPSFTGINAGYQTSVVQYTPGHVSTTSIIPFTATTACGYESPVFTYLPFSSPSFVKVDSTTGSITIQTNQLVTSSVTVIG